MLRKIATTFAVCGVLMFCAPDLARAQQSVGIGTNSPHAKLDIRHLLDTTDDNYLLLLHNPSNVTGSSAFLGFTVSGANGGFDGFNPGSIGFIRGTGLVFRANTGSGEIIRMTIRDSGLVGIGTTSPAAHLHINGQPGSTQTGLRSSINYSGLSDIRAVLGTSITNPGWGVGGEFTGGYIGVQATAQASDYDAAAFGVYGEANGTAGIRYGVYGRAANAGPTHNYGVYGEASGATNNWAGYFAGRGYFQKLGVGISDPQSDLHVQSLSGDGSVLIAPYESFQGSSELTFSENSYSTLFGMKIRYDGLADRLDFIAISNSTLTTRFSISRTSGNIGIGTINPLGAVDIRRDTPNLTMESINELENSAGLEQIARFRFRGHKNNLYRDAAYIEVAQNGTWSAVDQFYAPTAIKFYTQSGSSTNHLVSPRMILDGAGDLILGTVKAAGHKLSVDGKIACEEVRVELSSNWPDYVFETNYPLRPLDELKATISREGKLPGIPSASEVAEDGIVLGEMQRLMMEKIEELTLYILHQEERILQLETQIAKTQ